MKLSLTDHAQKLTRRHPIGSPCVYDAPEEGPVETCISSVFFVANDDALRVRVTGFSAAVLASAVTFEEVEK